LTPEQLQAFEHRLIAREAQLRREIESASLEVESDFERASEREVGDDAAKYAAHEGLSVERAEIGRDMSELREVQAALRRLSAGAYGRCVACDTPIPVQRLQAQPAALRCAACQTAFERG
jgi:RNA polymerase-binding transcription factor DksA